MSELRQLICILSDNLALAYRVEGLNSLIDLYNDFYTDRYGELVESALISNSTHILLPTLGSA